MKIRQPAVANRFYPDDANEIEALLDTIFQKEKDKIDYQLSEKQIFGGIVPHAGYMFSAYQALHFFEIIKSSENQYDTIVILNPNHTGYGTEIAVDDSDVWATPYSQVALDKEFIEKLKFPLSGIAHQYEHSGEVMLPLLQSRLDYDFQIVPITILKQDFSTAQQIAQAIHKASEQLARRVLVIASSDFSHYVSPHEGKRLDDFVLNEILRFSSKGVFREVSKKHISVCGYAPIMALMEYAKLQSTEPQMKMLRRGHSGEIVESDEVVHYISLLCYEN